MALMRAAILERAGPVESSPLAIRTVELPAPGPGEVLIRVAACAVCRTDLHVVEGDLGTRKSPVIPGHQVVGRIESFGSGGSGGDSLAVGARVGVAWLASTCGTCRQCAAGRENLCDSPEFTGWTRDGGFAEWIVADARFVYPIPEGFSDEQAAPLLCAGIIGYRSLRLTSVGSGPTTWRGLRLGIYGFGAAGHVVIQVARARGAHVYVCTRDRERHQSLAVELGATWVGGARDEPPTRLDAAIVFAPAGDLVPVALAALDKAGVLVLGGIHMSPIPELEYRLLYQERVVRTVANNERSDGHRFLAEAAAIPVRTHVRTFRLDQVNDALRALKHDAVRGAAVLRMGDPH